MMEKPVLRFLIFTLLFLQVTKAFAGVYYVAPNGSDDQPGTIDLPLASMQKAQEFVQPGDTVYIRGGTYILSENDISRVHNGLFACITFLDKSGTPGNMIKYWAYPGEQPIFDHSGVKPANQRNVGIYVTGSYLHIRGLEITGIQVTITSHTESYCIYSWGDNNIFELLKLHDGQGTGLRHRKGANNLFLNCDAYRNHDYTSQTGTGSNTDGFGCHPHDGGTGNVFRGCRAWFNSDDGYDVIGAMETVLFENCWAMYAGYSTSFGSLGDGNGFKAGGHATLSVEELPDPIPRHTVKFCLAVRNKASGFYSNHHIGGINWYNNSAYLNRYNYNMLNRLADNATDVPGYDHRLRNNLGYKGGTEIRSIDYDQCDNAYNYFDLEVSVSDEDFLSLDEALLVQPRQADGSLPDIDFMRLARGSDLVDRGEDIGFPYYGTAPDLGAFEQEYFSFPDSNATWYQYYYPSFYWEAGKKPTYMIFGLQDQDTMIHGLLYHKLFRFENELLESERAICIGALREDDAKKIYYRGDHPFSYPVADTGDILLYDFSVNVGDTIREGLFTSNEFLLVSEIDAVLIDGAYRKRINFKDLPHAKWIEGIGNERGVIFYSGELPLDGLWSDLTCFWQDDMEVFHHPDYEKCFVGLPDYTLPVLEGSEIKVFPNPSSLGFADIESAQELKNIQVINPSGDLVRIIQNFAGNTCRIRTENLPSGFYLLRLMDIFDQVHIRKLMIL